MYLIQDQETKYHSRTLTLHFLR